MENVSTAFRPDQINIQDRFVIEGTLRYEKTPDAIKFFDKNCEGMTDYSYWFILSTLWVSYTGYSDLNTWKRLFSSRRPNKNISLMKPDELKALKRLPNKFDVVRVHREGEQDWIAYTLDIKVAIRFAKDRKVSEISVYRLKKRDVMALFLRRGEAEIILLDKTKAKFVRTVKLDYLEA